jgi:hypothetical protein
VTAVSQFDSTKSALVRERLPDYEKSSLRSGKLFRPGYGYIVEVNDRLIGGTWTILTNVVPAYLPGTVSLPMIGSGSAALFYRIQVTSN